MPRWRAYLAARASVGLIITGGFSPNVRGQLSPGSSTLQLPAQSFVHRRLTDTIHDAGGRIALQILHAGRYGRTPWRCSPNTMTARQVRRTVADFARTAELAMDSGYDAIEIMGSEGYLINQFLAAATNTRDDQWGGSVSERQNFAVAVAASVRKAVGYGFPVIFRLSLADLVPGGQAWHDVLTLARRLEEAGVTAFNTGIGWHESRVPTIATEVPRAAWVDFTGRLREAVEVPVIASNRINNAADAERALSSGLADAVSMARPLLADPDFVKKVEAGRSELVTTCIACNQACLDHVFTGRTVSCLVNPQAGSERGLVLREVTPQVVDRVRLRPPSVLVVGAGPAGLAAAKAAAQRGFAVTLAEATEHLGGQFRYAMQVPGKEEFAQAIADAAAQVADLGVQVHTSWRVRGEDCADFDHVIEATGVTPRRPDIPGVGGPQVFGYDEVLAGRVRVGDRVVLIGAGGIAVDTAQFLLGGGSGGLSVEQVVENVQADRAHVDAWRDTWGVGDLGELLPREPRDPAPSVPAITLLSRGTAKPGARLGPTTGWIHRQVLRRAGVEHLGGVTYDEISNDGVWVRVDGQRRLMPADTVVLCAGQDSARMPGNAGQRPSAGAPQAVRPVVVGGALVAAELDAKRAIREAVEAVVALP